MLDPADGPRRERLTARIEADRVELRRQRESGVVVVDDRRRRPLYFDGRFLAARDLTREQQYLLAREADLARAGGFGVVRGLLVAAGPGASTILIQAGHGLTPAGELVVLSEPLTVELSDVPQIQRLDAAFGLAPIPRPPARALSGLFVIALRPVEFTANPIASYPTSIDGERGLRDGDIVEAAAVTLIPFPEGGEPESGLQRARLAHEIFVQGGRRGLPAEALPLAMVALERGAIRWLDSFLVRREVGAERDQLLSLGVAPRALREAHLLQYDRHLADVLRERQVALSGQRFAAADHFLALPPAGRLPAAAIDRTSFSQSYFPPEVEVDLSIVPADEVPALLEESLLYPPIDLTAPSETLESTSVLALVPVDRSRLPVLRAQLTSLQRRLLPAAPGLLARRSPLEQLAGLRLPARPLPPVDGGSIADAAWRELLAGAPLLWYVRRHHLSRPGELAGQAVRVLGDELQTEALLGERVRALGLTTRVNRLRTGATAEAGAEMVGLLGSEKLAASRVLLEGAVRELESARAPSAGPAPGETGAGPEAGPAEQPAERLDRATVLKVSERFADPRLGEGLLRLEQASGELRSNDRALRTLAQSGAVPELDLVARSLQDDELDGFARELSEVARRGESEAVGALVRGRLGELRR
jgi:hypothetical protein